MSENFHMKRLDDSDAEVYMYGDIGEFFGGISARSFADELKSLGNVKNIAVRMNSSGGDVFESMAIYHTLTRNRARVTMHIDGVSASAASLVAMAGDRIHIAENAMMMIHDPYVRIQGTAAELRERADRLDKLEANVRQVYANRSKRSEDEVDEWMSAETWWNAAEAVEMGFADEITGAMRVAAHVPKDRYKHVPQRLVKPETTQIDAYRDRLERLKVG